MAITRRREGPRQAVRWIGDAFVLEGDRHAGAPAVWRGDWEPRCAIVRHRQLNHDDDDDDVQGNVPLHAAASRLVGPHIVPRFVTYREGDHVVIVEDDVGDLSLQDLIDALRRARGQTPVELAVFIVTACAHACRAAESEADVVIDLVPRQIVLGWDGQVWLRPSDLTPEEQPDLERVDDAVGVAGHTGPLARILGVLLVELMTGRHPYDELAGESDDDDDEEEEDQDEDEDEDDEDDEDEDEDEDEDDEDDEDDVDERAALIQQRLMRGDRVLLEVEVSPAARAAIDRLLAVPPPNLEEALQILAGLTLEPLAAADLAGVLRALFPTQAREAEIEREDRLHIAPSARVMPESWALFDPDCIDEEDPWSLDLDDVRKGHGEDEGYEPSVSAIDPFDDD